ncbi:unnamed protein product [Polarella glacialis]|uniref:Uncharacterized protein n=1 Tax=Polarella glacialis TaxID=89957 RepID=A0A813IWI1_POLGL|nr:unnamed protein product [Polarella glacialis]
MEDNNNNNDNKRNKGAAGKPAECRAGQLAITPKTSCSCAGQSCNTRTTAHCDTGLAVYAEKTYPSRGVFDQYVVTNDYKHGDQRQLALSLLNNMSRHKVAQGGTRCHQLPTTARPSEQHASHECDSKRRRIVAAGTGPA